MKLFAPKPPSLPPLPTMPTDNTAAEEARRKSLDAAAKARGRASTLLTAPDGGQTAKTGTVSKSILGG